MIFHGLGGSAAGRYASSVRRASYNSLSDLLSP